MRKFRLDGRQIFSETILKYQQHIPAGMWPGEWFARFTLSNPAYSIHGDPAVLSAEMRSLPKGEGELVIIFQFDRSPVFKKGEPDYNDAVSYRLAALKDHFSETEDNHPGTQKWISETEFGDDTSTVTYVLQVTYKADHENRETFIEATARVYRWYVDKMGKLYSPNRKNPTLRPNHHEINYYIMVGQPGTRKKARVKVHDYVLDKYGF